MNNIAYFEIQASDPKLLADFYQKVFDWKFTLDPNIPIAYYRIEGAGAMGAILQRPVEAPPMKYGTNAYTCSIEVDNFDATAKKIMDGGGVVAMAKFAIPGKCWQGYFVDPDHNVFGIFQADANAK